MEVYLIPVGPDRYELYCEPADDDSQDERTRDRSSSLGLRQRVSDWFSRTLRSLEKEHEANQSGIPATEGPDGGWFNNVRSRSRRWLAERIAEQRLLWRLRRCASASVVYPGDLGEADATTVLRRMLRRDADRHRVWMIIHGLALALSVVLVWIPGPNLVAYYFGFRLLGHLLSFRGARQGLERVSWSPSPSPPLADLRQAISLTSPAREQRVSEIASRLRLEHLPRFVERTAMPGA